MPLSRVYPHGTPLSDVRTYDGAAPFATHTHVYLDGRSGPDTPPRRMASLPAASHMSSLDRMVRRHVRDAGLLGASPPPTTRLKSLATDEDEPVNIPPPGEARVVARLPAPPEGMHYVVESQSDGWVICLEAGPPPHPLYGNMDGKPDPKLRRMNDAARRLWRDQNSGPDVENLVYVLDDPGPGGRYELRPNPNGTVNIVWTGPSVGGNFINGVQPPGATGDLPGKGTRPATPQLLGGNTPLGASGDGPEINSGSSRPERDAVASRALMNARDRQRSVAQLRAMNAAARAYWRQR
jgi:hypothetical protein